MQDEDFIPVDSDSDSAYGEWDRASSTASVTSSILQYRELHGRTYENFKTTEYWAPNDETHNDMLDIGHHMLMLMLDGALFLAPIGSNPQKIIDVGTGTGIWAMDVAEQFPSAEVLGTDLSDVQPRFVPPNCKFELDDAQLEWTFEPSSFDFVHLRCLFGGISDWRALYGEIFRCLKPGGWVQNLEFSVEFKCDDRSFDKDSILYKWGKLFIEGGVKMGREFNIIEHSRQYMADAGYVEIQEKKFKLPVGPWSSDRKMKEIGAWNHHYMLQGLEGMCLFLFTKILGWSFEELQVFLAKVRAALLDRKIHCYYEAVVVYGRKPLR